MDAIRQRTHEILEGTREGDLVSRLFELFMVVLIAANVLAVILETVPSLDAAHAGFFLAFEVFSVAIFTVEYVLRVWATVEDRRRAGVTPIAGRLRHMLTPMAVIDLLAFLPFYLSAFFAVDLRFLRVLRLLRILKLTHYSPALETFARVLRNERTALVAALLMLGVVHIFVSSLMFVFEQSAQPEAFGSIPAALWWGIVTLTTVGYGDVAPVTLGGKIFGGPVTVMGVAMFALPAGILASGFNQEIRKRDFAVTWSMVAKVPLFAGLDARRVAEIVELLHPRLAAPEKMVIRLGERGDAMYVIVAGETAVEREGVAPIGLHTGDFFGEIALIDDRPRTATVRAVTTCQLLALRAKDFKELVDTDSEVRAAVRRVASERLAEPSEGGDAEG